MGRYGEEMVWVVRRQDLFGNSTPQGFLDQGIEEFRQIMNEKGFFARRADVEEDPTLQQIIPYMVFRHQNRYFLMQRIAGSTDTRLHNLYSLGVGGHINPIDSQQASPVQDVIWAGMRREWEEEVEYEGQWQAKPLGLIKDDSDSVNSVHVGLVYLIDGDTDQISPKEKDHHTGQILPWEEIKALYGQLEVWSQIVVTELEARQVSKKTL